MAFPQQESHQLQLGTGRSSSNLTSYIRYTYSKQFELAKQMGPGSNLNDVFRQIAESWQKMSSFEQGEWEECADTTDDDDSHSNEKIMANFLHGSPHTTHGDGSGSGSGNGTGNGTGAAQNIGQQLRIPPPPKRPTPAFLCFARRHKNRARTSDTNLRGAALMKHLGEMWQRLNPKEREPYLNMEKQSRKEYMAAMKEWTKRANHRTAATAKLRSPTVVAGQQQSASSGPAASRNPNNHNKNMVTSTPAPTAASAPNARTGQKQITTQRFTKRNNDPPIGRKDKPIALDGLDDEDGHSCSGESERKTPAEQQRAAKQVDKDVGHFMQHGGGGGGPSSSGASSLPGGMVHGFPAHFRQNALGQNPVIDPVALGQSHIYQSMLIDEKVRKMRDEERNKT